MFIIVLDPYHVKILVKDVKDVSLRLLHYYVVLLITVI